MSKLIRADLLLSEAGLAESRTAAQNLITAGRVHVLQAGERVTLSKPAQKLLANSVFEIDADPADRYVSRGGLKLAGALERTGISALGLGCLDIGISTGGFADCLVQAGAARVVGVDVGHGQLHPRLAEDRRIFLLEGVNARALEADILLPLNLGQAFDLIVADVSFISLALILPPAVPLLAPGGKLLCLVKPQFEVGREGVGRGGIVRDTALYAKVREKIEGACTALGLIVADWFDSPITGGDGNHEFFVYAHAIGPALADV